MLILTSQFLLGTASATDVSGFDAGKEPPTTQKSYVNSDIIGSNGRFSNTDSIESKGKFVSTEMIASQDKKITCPVPPQKKKPQTKLLPKPESVTKADATIITNVCAPVININMPWGVSHHPSQSTNDGPAAALPSTTDTIDSSSDEVPPIQPTQAPDSFKFKIKNWVEAEITTHSLKILIFFICIFLIFAAIGAYSFKAAIRHGPKAIRIATGAILVILFGAFAAYWAIMNIAPQKIEDTFNEHVKAEALAAKADPRTRTDSILDFPEQQLPLPQTEAAKPQHQPASLDEFEKGTDSEKNSAEWWWIFINALIAICTLAALIHVYFSREQNKSNRFISLDDIYNLENEILITVATTNSSHEPPTVQLNPLLNSINQARKHLESDEKCNFFSEIKSATFFVRAEPDNYLYLKNKLMLLDDFLSTRHEKKRSEWKIEAFKHLTATRQDILKICEVGFYDEDTGIKVNRSK